MLVVSKADWRITVVKKNEKRYNIFISAGGKLR